MASPDHTIKMSEAPQTAPQAANLLSLPNETLGEIAAELPLLRLKIFSTLSKRLRKVAVSDTSHEWLTSAIVDSMAA